MPTMVTLRPLLRGSTLRWVYLMLGAALVLAFVLVDSSLVALIGEMGGPAAVRIAVAVVLIAAPPVLLGIIPAVREVEGIAVESLLGVRFDERPLAAARTWPQRRRTSLWFVMHLVSGGIVGLATAIAVPVGIMLTLAPFRATGRHDILPGLEYEVTGRWTDIWLPAAAAGGIVVPFVLTAVLGTLLARWAPHVLGPTAAERIDLLERRTATLAERNRLARELHDSVGHALSLVTLQAGAARRVLDTDPAFARTALGAMEESARSALADLDHVLGLLRDDRGGATGTAPQSTLSDLPRLVEGTRAGGVTVTIDADAGLDAVPAAVSREAYRIIQEGITNAIRHAGVPTGELDVAVRIRSGSGRLRLEVSNPVRQRELAGTRRSGGRGLAGIRERVAVLRGSVESGPDTGSGKTDDTTWRLAVSLPLVPTKGQP